MKKRILLLILALAASMLLGGCAMKTVDELYCLPKRSPAYNNWQAVVDEAMDDLEPCVPQSGDYRQFLQAADLDGDGLEEYVIFAKDDSEKPLKILIFCQLASGYVLMDTIEGYGFGFDFVAYEQMDDRPGLEIVVGRLVSEDVVRSVSVYRFSSGIARHLYTGSYGRVTLADLDKDGVSSLYLLNQGTAERPNGSLSVYTYQADQLQREAEVDISCAADGYKQIVAGALDDGKPAIYVTCSEADGLTTDVFCVEDQQLQLVAGHVRTPLLTDVYVYPEDLDKDGVLEIPSVLDLLPVQEQQHQFIAWYTLDATGSETVCRYTYHNFADNWYMTLDAQQIQGLATAHNGGNCTFYMRNQETGEMLPLLTIFALMDADREDLALQPGRVVLYRSDSVIYVADLTEYAADYGVTAVQLAAGFSTIRMDLNQEEN